MTKYLVCLSKEDAKALKRTSSLPEQGERGIQAIIAPKGVEERLKRWNKGSLRNVLRKMGRKNLEVVAFVEVKGDVETFGPFPREYGLLKYKLPTGIKVSSYDLLKL